MKNKDIFIIVMAVYLGLTIYAFTNSGILPESVAMYLAYIPFLLFTYIFLKWVIEKVWAAANEFWKIIIPLFIAALFYVLLAIHVFLVEPLICPCLGYFLSIIDLDSYIFFSMYI